MSTKFTPGPLTVLPTGLVRADVLSESGRPVCKNVLQADAHLFAAAPELYEALSLASRHAKRWPHNWNEADVAVLENALAKARGES